LKQNKLKKTGRFPTKQVMRSSGSNNLVDIDKTTNVKRVPHWYKLKTPKKPSETKPYSLHLNWKHTPYSPIIHVQNSVAFFDAITYVPKKYFSEPSHEPYFVVPVHYTRQDTQTNPNIF
jgi:hypothetical protein